MRLGQDRFTARHLGLVLLGYYFLLLTDTRAEPEGNDQRMTTSSGWCLAADHTHCAYPDCGCNCHQQVEGQGELIPDERTTTEVPF